MVVWRTEHEVYAYGQSSFEGWACKGCWWDAPSNLDYDTAKEKHDAEVQDTR